MYLCMYVHTYVCVYVGLHIAMLLGHIACTKVLLEESDINLLAINNKCVRSCDSHVTMVM